MTTVEPSYRRPWVDSDGLFVTLDELAARCASPWFTVPHPNGSVTYYRDKREAIEHSQRLYVRFGATVVVSVVDGLPRG